MESTYISYKIQSRRLNADTIPWTDHTETAEPPTQEQLQSCMDLVVSPEGQKRYDWRVVEGLTRIRVLSTITNSEDRS